jgi:hypothetical protein
MIRYYIENYVLLLRLSTSSQIVRSCDVLGWSVELPGTSCKALPERCPTPQQIVAAEAETSSGAFKKGIIIGALGLLQPTFALKLIIATGIFLDVCS